MSSSGAGAAAVPQQHSQKRPRENGTSSEQHPQKRPRENENRKTDFPPRQGQGANGNHVPPPEVGPLDPSAKPSKRAKTLSKQSPPNKTAREDGAKPAGKASSSAKAPATGPNRAKKILVLGSVEGRLTRAFEFAAAENRKKGPFDVCFCVGGFLPDTTLKSRGEAAEAGKELGAFVRGEEQVGFDFGKE